MSEKKNTIQTKLKELEDLAAWFERNDEFDVEEGMKKVREGSVLVRELKERLKAVENEFRELEADLKSDQTEP